MMFEKILCILLSTRNCKFGFHCNLLIVAMHIHSIFQKNMWEPPLTSLLISIQLQTGEDNNNIVFGRETYNQHPMLSSFLIVTCYLHSFADLKKIAIPHHSTYYMAKLDIIICQITNLPNLLE